MQIVCPICNTQYAVAADKLPKKIFQTTCKKCGGAIRVEPSTGQDTVLNAQVDPVAAFGAPPESKAGDASTPPRERSAAELTLITEYPELQALSSDNLELEEIFAAGKKGNYKSRRNKLKLKLLKAVQGNLDRMLRDDEKVMRIGKATAYHPVEIFFGNGYLTMMYNHYAIIGTSQRLILININSKVSKPTHYYFQVGYEGIRKVTTGLFGTSLVLHRHKGKRRIFTGMKRYLAKEFKEFIAGRLSPALSGQLTESAAEDLCPSCFMPLGKNLLTCPNCKTPFKNPMSAFLRSLLLPGLGDIYLGHKLLGVVELLGSMLVWAVVIFSVLGGSQGSLIVALFLLVFYNGFDSLLTRHMAKKGYMLAEK